MIAIAVLIYLILLGVFYKVEKNEFECGLFMDDCLHVCSSAKEQSDVVIKARLSEGSSETKYGILDWVDQDSFRIIRGDLKCLETKVIESKDIHDDMTIDEFHPALLMNFPEKYCLDFPDDKDNSEEGNETLSWKMHICSTNVIAQRIFHGIGKIINLFI